MTGKNDTKRNFDLNHHGDEVIVSTDDKGMIHLDVKIQESRDEFRAIKLSFETQTQMERLFYGIMKGLAVSRNGRG